MTIKNPNIEIAKENMPVNLKTIYGFKDSTAETYAKENGKNVHFMGLTSDGGVHSSLDHLFKLCDIAKEYNIENTFVHCFMDGRDTDPKSGKGFIEELSSHCEKSAGKMLLSSAVITLWTVTNAGNV